MKKLIFVLFILFFNISLILASKIDNISCDLDNGAFIISGPKGEILNYHLDDSLMNYEYILDTPYFKLNGYDGVVELGKSKGLKSFPKKKLTVESFTKFAFFSREVNTIGFLIGGAGGSGGSSQTAYFINTQTGNSIKIDLTDMVEMFWITKNDQIIGYKQYDTGFSFGAHSVSWGYKPRLSAIVYFDEFGNLTFDKNGLQSIMKSEYEKIKFSDGEKALLQDNIMSDIKHRQLGEKLVDFVYYGLKIGKQKEVFEFLNTLNPIYIQEAKN